jgi:hypothetical protein
MVPVCQTLAAMVGQLHALAPGVNVIGDVDSDQSWLTSRGPLIGTTWWKGCSSRVSQGSSAEEMCR